MRSQMRVAAALWSLNFLIGWTPGRLLRIATSRFAGQDLASSANSCWLRRGQSPRFAAAASVLFKLMTDAAMPPSVRARTAQCILEFAHKSLELEDTEVRLAALERAMGVFAEGELRFPKAA
jgi:hypothetical protein